MEDEDRVSETDKKAWASPGRNTMALIHQSSDLDTPLAIPDSKPSPSTPVVRPLFNGYHFLQEAKFTQPPPTCLDTQ